MRVHRCARLGSRCACSSSGSSVRFSRRPLPGIIIRRWWGITRWAELQLAADSEKWHAMIKWRFCWRCPRGQRISTRVCMEYIHAPPLCLCSVRVSVWVSFLSHFGVNKSWNPCSVVGVLVPVVHVPSINAFILLLWRISNIENRQHHALLE